MDGKKETSAGLLIRFAIFGVVIAAHISIFGHITRDPKLQSDFAVFYSAGSMVTDGAAGRLYDREAQSAAQLRATGKPGLNFISPPWVAILFAPFSLFQLKSAYVVWLGLSLLTLGATAAFLVRIAPLFTHTSVMTLALLLFVPIHAGLALGQLSLIVLLALCACLYRIRRGRDLQAGLLLSLGLVKPHLVLPAALLLILFRGRRFAAGFAGGFAILVGVTAAILGPGPLWDYPWFLASVENLRSAGVHPQTMPNLRGALALLSGDRTLSLGLLAVVSIALLLLAAWAWRSARTPAQRDLAFSLGVTVTLLIAYHSNHADLSLLALPMVLALYHASASVQGDWWFFLSSAPFLFPPTYLALYLLLPFPLMVIPLLAFSFYLAVRSGIRLPVRSIAPPSHRA